MKIAGLVEVAGTLSVYPLVDFTIPRAEKEARYQVAEEEGRTTKSWKRIDDVIVRRREREEGVVDSS
jgi:hypothetical protein